MRFWLGGRMDAAQGLPRQKMTAKGEIADSHQSKPTPHGADIVTAGIVATLATATLHEFWKA